MPLFASYSPVSPRDAPQAQSLSLLPSPGPPRLLTRGKSTLHVYPRISSFIFFLSASVFVFLTISLLTQGEHAQVVHISGSIGEALGTLIGHSSSSSTTTTLNKFNPQLTDRFPTRLNPTAHNARPVTSHVLTWVIRYETQLATDGVSKSVYTVNGQYPGPTIEARSGDRIILTVKNELPDNETTSIHFHGIRHIGSNAMDGATGVTQCPIPVDGSFIYDFTIDERQSGAYWWHSHSNHQRADGLYGAFIIHKPTTEDTSVKPAESKDSDEEHVIMVGDWYHRTAPEMVAWYRSKKSLGWEPTPDNILVNGVNTFDCGRLIRWYECDAQKGKKPLIVLEPDWNQRKKLRVVNVGNLADVEVSVGSHTLQIVEADGSPIRPYSVSSVVISPGQRYSFYIEHDGLIPIKPGDSFWMRTRFNRKDFNMPNPVMDPVHFFPIFYGDPRYIPLSSIPPTRVFTIPVDTSEPFFDALQLEALEQVPLPAADIQFMMYINTMKLDSLGGIPYGYVNQSSWLPDLWSPMLLRSEVTAGGDKNTEYQGVGGWANKNELVYVTDRKDTKVIEIIINNLDDGPHPLHLHGHHFYPLTTFKSRVGWGSYDYSTGHVAPRFAPVLRDTMTIPRRGYAVIRFVADAPGLWLFHCHVLVHLSSGMAMVFSVRPDSIPDYERLSVMDGCVHNNN